MSRRPLTGEELAALLLAIREGRLEPPRPELVEVDNPLRRELRPRRGLE